MKLTKELKKYKKSLEDIADIVHRAKRQRMNWFTRLFDKIKHKK